MKRIATLSAAGWLALAAAAAGEAAKGPQDQWSGEVWVTPHELTPLPYGPFVQDAPADPIPSGDAWLAPEYLTRLAQPPPPQDGVAKREEVTTGTVK